MGMWKREMMSFALASRTDVKYSLTEKCANWITGEPSTSTTASKLEHVDITVFSGSSGRQSARNVGVDLVSKSNARNSASSLTRSGRDAAATHWNRWCAHSQFWSQYLPRHAHMSHRVQPVTHPEHAVCVIGGSDG